MLGIPALGALIALGAARFLDPWSARSAKPAPTTALPSVFWTYIVAAGVIALGFVDFPLLAYHFQKTKLFDQPTIPLLFAMAMGINGVVALVLGRLFDRFGLAVLVAGLVASSAALPLGFLGGPTAAVAAVALWATGMGAQDATLRAGISQVVSMNKRGSAFGTFNALYGIMWFVGSLVMGKLYDTSMLDGARDVRSRRPARGGRDVPSASRSAGSSVELSSRAKRGIWAEAAMTRRGPDPSSLRSSG